MTVTKFRVLFVVAALWNAIGAASGYFQTADTFYNFFQRELSDPLFYAIYKGAWGTTLVYIAGYLIVAKDPLRHTGIVIVGGLGKVGFAITLLNLYFAGLASSIVWVVIVGDVAFSILFLAYLITLYRNNVKLV
ncbi:MAG: hypothetical protein F9K24_00070 [Leptonema illini]|uniref:Uncharacterized protein n=1 Tax=Leptonema illini TaxID=183 RepID=A0A833H4E8_9LEPT|nr:MAG: hypothetical protein F9K24_00070 [Leptonema illini]PKL33572.1 MAG: hypothetical protein CVV45_07055 [Spirochaetae bacterium HGW-Spirochaetae-10]